jgi:hypothetical protein
VATSITWIPDETTILNLRHLQMRTVRCTAWRHSGRRSHSRSASRETHKILQHFSRFLKSFAQILRSWRLDSHECKPLCNWNETTT